MGYNGMPGVRERMLTLGLWKEFVIQVRSAVSLRNEERLARRETRNSADKCRIWEKVREAGVRSIIRSNVIYT